jgi:hypothetical protein
MRRSLGKLGLPSKRHRTSKFEVLLKLPVGGKARIPNRTYAFVANGVKRMHARGDAHFKLKTIGDDVLVERLR